MAALTPPTIKKGVLNRLPFLADTAPNTEKIDDFTSEVFAELQHVLGKTDAEYLDEDNYNPKETSLISDIVAIYLIQRKTITNMEGSEGAASTATSILK